MKNQAILTDTVKFDRQRSGYDIEQVDRYINTLTYEYQTVCSKYTSVRDKFHRLLESYSQLKQQSDSIGANSNALVKPLIDAEALAKQIIAKAEEEAERIRGDAYIEKAAAKRCAERSKEYLCRTIAKMQELAAF